MYMIAEVSQYVAVASFSEAWIEIVSLSETPTTPTRRLLLGGVDWNFHVYKVSGLMPVASFSEAWIEIPIISGSKLLATVASFSEAWIEMTVSRLTVCSSTVASFSEAWIEIISLKRYWQWRVSPPSWRRGLKFRYSSNRKGYCCRLLFGVEDWNSYNSVRFFYKKEKDG